MRIAIAIMALLCLSTTVTAKSQNGQALFNEHCSACHGLDGMGGVGTPLALPSFIDTVTDSYLAKSIRHGRPGRIMPAFQKLTHSEVQAIVGHIRGWSDQPPPKEVYQLIKGDPANGHKLFAQHCAKCHGKEGEGGEGTGVTFSRPRDLPIIAPALNNSGFLAAASNQMIRNTILHGRNGTPMDPYKDVLSGQQMDDITLFIRSLEAKAHPRRVVADKPEMILKMESPYSFRETVENVRRAAGSANFVVIRDDFLEHGLVPTGKENPKQVRVDFCNFSFLNQALKIDPRIGLFLPCRITISEHNGKVFISTVNPKALGALFNNYALDQACQAMSEMYQEILDEATL